MGSIKTQAAIIATLVLLGTRVHRTKVVKLIYLVDLKYSELTGRTLTGLSYMWDYYGPNAVSNAIVHVLDNLVKMDKVRMVARHSIHGTDSFMYWLPEGVTKQGLSRLEPGEEQVIRDTINEFGSLSLRKIVEASKKTTPFQGAKQFEVLKLPDRPITTHPNPVTENSQLLTTTHKGLQDLEKGKLLSQEELDELYSRQSNGSIRAPCSVRLRVPLEYPLHFLHL